MGISGSAISGIVAVASARSRSLNSTQSAVTLGPLHDRSPGDATLTIPTMTLDHAVMVEGGYLAG
jgi:hypothetical protein